MKINYNEVILKFKGFEKKVLLTALIDDVVDIDFGGNLMVRFEKKDGEFIATNAMNGWGDNVADEVFGDKLMLEYQTATE